MSFFEEVTNITLDDLMSSNSYSDDDFHVSIDLDEVLSLNVPYLPNVIFGRLINVNKTIDEIQSIINSF